MTAAERGTTPDGEKSPALQVIVLGSGGGPIEHNTTALLVRSLASGWHRGSTIAVDAGVHLGAIARILESTQPKGLGTDVPLPHTLTTGPFAGLEVQSSCPNTNAAYITQSLIDTYLITHPHLDHISGFVVNTAGFPGTRPKRLAGQPSTIHAFKTHIFNNVIWPNLSDENNGAGLVTYMRLVEGGSPALGEGEERGYLEISDGLAVKMWSVSHGHCIEKHSHRGSQSSQGGLGSGVAPGSRFGSADASAVASPRHLSFSHSHGPNLSSGPASALPLSRLGSLLNPPTAVGAATQNLSSDPGASICVYDSSAYFIRDVVTGKEVLIFGDVEPDSVSLSPRNLRVWREAAPKVASGALSGVFIECSYDNGQPVDRLFGHLKPCYIVEELKVLAAEVEEVRRTTVRESRKRKRSIGNRAREREDETEGDVAEAGLAVRRKVYEEPISPKSMKPLGAPVAAVPPCADDSLDNGSTSAAPGSSQCMATPSSDLSGDNQEYDEASNGHTGAHVIESKGPPLKGLRVVIIHVKDKLVDGFVPGERILRELCEEEEIENLGCEFIISSVGQSLLF
ncbi:hypothetical protein jhhlp_002040 [Lomentospora prolificans]|uniref:3',5'-cyclic-nucleotide phosphodiesterase n=1 Tax=Lomentospora prolificans TaxID=41688 RepID=A0A2N3NCY5_9PEZI|nr:hypothetical protein jhhlp_002040 [Lomentospora prolificans]